MENSNEHREFYPEETLEDCLNLPEIIDELSLREREAIIALAEAMILEIYEPDIKAKYRQLIQALRMGNAADSASYTVPMISANFPYFSINVDGNPVTIKPLVNTVPGIHHPALSSIEEIQFDQLDRAQSHKYFCFYRDPEQRFWVNLIMFVLIKKDGEQERIMYIADWYVSPNLREGGIGSQLQGIANEAAISNNCSMIFATLMPDDLNDMDRLQAANINRGFEIRTIENITMAVKKL